MASTITTITLRRTITPDPNLSTSISTPEPTAMEISMTIASDGQSTTAAMVGHTSSHPGSDHRYYGSQKGNKHPMQKGWMLQMENYARRMEEVLWIKIEVDRMIRSEAEESMKWAKETEKEIRRWIDQLRESKDEESAEKFRDRLTTLLVEIDRVRRDAEVLVENLRGKEELVKRSSKEWTQFAKDIWVIGRPSTWDEQRVEAYAISAVVILAFFRILAVIFESPFWQGLLKMADYGVVVWRGVSEGFQKGFVPFPTGSYATVS
ncbi:hypothetical protein TWF281_003097 [Arthrobotrys megalospora]